MKIAIDTETRAVLTWRGGEVPSLSMTRGDRFPVEVKFISSGKFVEWPAMASGKLMLKQPGAYTALPVASALGWVKSGSGANAVYKFDLNLNTVELNALLTGASVNLVLEIEWIYENVTQSSVPVQVVVSKDYIQGNEAAPVNAVSFREVQLQKNATHVQWRYVGDLVWTNLVALDDLKGSEVEFQKGTTHIQWRYVGGTTWTDLVALDDLKGAAGSDGREVEFQKGASLDSPGPATHIQWRYVGEATWTDLVALDDLKGADGINGNNGADGINGNNGNDGAPGVDGSNGREVEISKGTTHIQWRYLGDETMTDLVALDDLKGADGRDGVDALWNFTGPYDAGQVYAVGDIATYEGQTWYRKDANGGNVGDTPSEGAFWTIVSAAGTNAIGTTSGVPIITGTNGVLQAGQFGAGEGTFCQGNDSRFSSIQPNSRSASYTLQLSDAGKYINISTGSVTVPSAVFASGDVISVYNNSAANQTITQGSGVTMYLAGTSTTGNRTLAQRGVATILCVGSNTFTIIGGGLT